MGIKKKEFKMKAKIMGLVVIMVVILSNLCSITLVDLDFNERLIVKEFIIEIDDDITLGNFESLEGIEYEILYEIEGYIIVIIDDEIFIIPKD